MADHRTGYNRFHGLQVGPSPWWKSSQTVSEDPHGPSPNAASSPWPAWLLLGRSGTSGQGDHAPGTDVFRVADWYRNHPGTSSTDVDCQQNLQLVICNIQCTFMCFFCPNTVLLCQYLLQTVIIHTVLLCQYLLQTVIIHTVLL